MAIITVSNTGGNWNSSTTWVGGVVPLSTDSVVFTATSGNLNINVLSTITDFNLSNFTGTITFTNDLEVRGNLNFGTVGYTQSGANGITKTTGGTITSNGTIWSRRFRFKGTFTTTLNDNLNLSGQIVFQAMGSPNTVTVNGFNIYHTGSFGITTNGGSIVGTTKYWYQGTGATWGQTAAAISVNIDFYVNTVGTLTLSGTAPTGFTFGGGKELKIISGTLNTSGLSALSLSGRIVDLTGSTINNLQLRSGTPNTLLAAVYTNTLTCFASATGICNGFKIFTKNLTQQTGVSNIQGNTVIEINGTGTWSNAGTGVITNNLIINTPGTFTISGNVRYNTGTLTYTSGTVITTGSTLIITASTTLDTDRGTSKITWNNITCSTLSFALILTTDLTCQNFSQSTGGTNFSGVGRTFFINGNLTHASGSDFFGSATIQLSGTGTVTTSSTGSFINTIVINTTGTITFSGTIRIKGGSITHTNGTVTTTGSTFLVSTSTTLDVKGSPTSTSTTSSTGVNFNDLVVTGGTIQLFSNVTVIGNFISSNPITYTGSNLILNGNLTINQATFGTTVFIYKGTGAWSGAGTINNLFQINNPLGTLTCSGTISASNLSRIAGTVNTSGSTLVASTSSNTWNTVGIIWDNVTVNAGSVNLPSLLTVSGILTVGGSNNVSFTGISGFSVANLSCTTAGRIITLASGITYNITNNLNLVGTSGSKITLTSGTPRAVFTLSYGATQNVKNTNATNIDSSLGQTILSSAGVLTNTLNWSIGSGNFFLMF